MKELPEGWWELTDEELRDCEIPAQPECAECGGACCAPTNQDIAAQAKGEA